MRLLVIFHAYYENLVEYYIEKMGNIHSCDWTLIVTGNNFSTLMRNRIRAFKPDAVFLETPNVGYDVWPFIQGIKSVNLDDYDIVIKLHTKNEDVKNFRLHGEFMNGLEWMRYMVEALIGSKEAFGKLVNAFESNVMLGIAYSQKLDFISKGGHPEDGSMLEMELQRLGITRKSSHFCAGTIFAVKSCTLKFLQSDDIAIDEFQPSGPSHGSSSMAHVYERLIPIKIVSDGYDLMLIPSSRASAMWFAIKNFFGPFLKWLVSIDYYGDDHKKYLKIFGHKFQNRF